MTIILKSGNAGGAAWTWGDGRIEGGAQPRPLSTLHAHARGSARAPTWLRSPTPQKPAACLPTFHPSGSQCYPPVGLSRSPSPAPPAVIGFQPPGAKTPFTLWEKTLPSQNSRSWLAYKEILDLIPWRQINEECGGLGQRRHAEPGCGLTPGAVVSKRARSSQTSEPLRLRPPSPTPAKPR